MRSPEDRIKAAVLAEREACAAIADAYADENMAMAQDTILLDPVMSGRDRSGAGFAKAKDLMIEGCVHSSMYHAARSIAEAIRKRVGTVALALLLLATQAHAADLTVPAGTILCHSADAAVRSDHVGCWRAVGGQRVEIIAALADITQLRLWSTNGVEAVTAWAKRADADRMQRSGR